MKTKNFLLTGALLIVALFSVNGVMAQVQDYTTNATTTSAVKVSLIFNPIQSIQVNPDQKEINFEYSTPNDYTQGIDEKSQLKEDHLTVYHSGPFNVTITSTNFVNTNNSTDIITGDHVLVSAVIGKSSTDFQGTITPATAVSLNQNAAGSQFIASDNGAMGLTFDVLYDHSNANIADYLKRNLNNKKTTYQATVTYTIAAQ